MEQIVIKFAAFSGDRELAERAFMTGILSLMDVLFEAPMPEVVKQLNITEDIRRALVDREGPLGILLQLAEKVEQTEFEAVGPLLERSRITLDQLLEAQLETINWANGLDLMV
jgi:EAL and modified HD-GYP domain-containing signal transduction protein